MSPTLVSGAEHGGHSVRARLAAMISGRRGDIALYAAAIALVAGAYYLAGRLGLELAYLDGAVAAVGPPAGLGLAVLFLYGIRLWPGIVVGDLLLADFSTPLGTVLGQTVGNTLALVVAAVLLVVAELAPQRDVPYIVFPVLLWAALRLGPRGAATAIVVVCSITVWNTAQEDGPFVRDSITDSLLATQLFIATAALTSLLLAAVTAER